MYDYSYFLHTKCAEKWKNIGLKRRSGIVAPLFSIYSKHSVGIGEITDLKLLIDWCNKTGISIIQLLPINDTAHSAPYSALSTFAIDSMYISLIRLRDVNLKQFKNKINTLRNKYNLKGKRVDYAIKDEKLKLLKKIFNLTDWRNNKCLNEYILQNSYWLNDYCTFRIISDKMGSNWNLWEKEYSPLLYIEIIQEYTEEFNFHCWVQWQLFVQMQEIKKYANEKRVLLMGDLPFLVSKESADVWSHPEYFKLQLSAGAPPDMYHSSGQKWGTPPYDWNRIAADNFVYLRRKLKYAENFYNMYRIDHFVGLFRLWSVYDSPNSPANAINGYFDPGDECLWEKHGKKILDIMLESTSMLPCAEDLGTVPECSYKTLFEYGITGIDFQRYQKSNFCFKKNTEYRINSVSVLSTHDSTLFCNWWNYEAGAVDEKMFGILCKEKNITGKRFNEIKSQLFNLKKSLNGRLRWNNKIDSVDKLKLILGLHEYEAQEFIHVYLDTFNEKNKFAEFLNGSSNAPKRCTPAFFKDVLMKINSSSSIFSIQLIQEYLCLDEILLKHMNKWSYRINLPGSSGKKNWSVLLPVSLDSLLKSYRGKFITGMLREINIFTDRFV
jgi:4-alpha-glucanotransferase